MAAVVRPCCTGGNAELPAMTVVPTIVVVIVVVPDVPEAAMVSVDVVASFDPEASVPAEDVAVVIAATVVEAVPAPGDWLLMIGAWLLAAKDVPEAEAVVVAVPDGTVATTVLSASMAV